VTFQELPLRESLLKAITERGYVEPTEIQQLAIPPLATTDTDFVGQAQTGTGKTAAFRKRRQQSWSWSSCRTCSTFRSA
jgi:ATP-dependent RNA helicase DeaD